MKKSKQMARSAWRAFVKHAWDTFWEYEKYLPTDGVMHRWHRSAKP